MSKLDDVADEDLDELGIEKDVASWIEAEGAKEVARLKACGQRHIQLVPKNMAILRTKRGGVGRGAAGSGSASEMAAAAEEIIVNRVEIGTRFNFNKIRSIMVSEDRVPCPAKADFMYVNVAMFTDNMQLPIIMPYLYDGKEQANDLAEWEFVNAEMSSSRHSVHFAISGEGDGEGETGDAGETGDGDEA